MARQIKGGASVDWPDNVILQRPEMAALLGNICSEHSKLDVEVTTLYATVMSAFLPADPLADFVDFPIWHPVAFQVFDALEASRKRLELIEKLLEWVTPDLLPSFRESVQRSVHKANKSRNNVVHARWGVSVAHPTSLIYCPPPHIGSVLVYDKRDFEKVLGDIKVARIDIEKFQTQARERVRQARSTSGSKSD